MFDPIRIYDKPAVILTQLGNGIATSDSVRRTLIDPSALSPRERQSYADEFKKSVGGNPVTDTIIDVLSNPLTWLAFVSGGAMATKNFAKSGRFFTGGVEAAGYGTWNKSKWPLMRFFGMLSTAQELHGTAIPQLLEMIPGAMKKYQREFSKPVNAGVKTVLDQLSSKHGVKITSLDPESAPTAAAQHDLEIIRSTLTAKLAGYDTTAVHQHVKGLKPKKYEIHTTWTDAQGNEHSEWLHIGNEKAQFQKFEKLRTSGKNVIKLVRNEAGEIALDPDGIMSERDLLTVPLEHTRDGSYRRFEISDRTGLRGDAIQSGVDVDYADIKRGVLVGDINKLNRTVQEFGLQGLIDGVDFMRKQVKAKLYGDDEHFARTGEFKVDRNKILKTSRAAIGELKDRNMIGQDGRLVTENASAVNQILTDDVAGVIAEYGKKNPGRGMSIKELEDLIVDTHIQMIDDPYYLPRNTTAVYRNVGGNKVEVEPSPFSRPGTFVEGMGREITPSGRTKFRVRQAVALDPDDLQRMADQFGMTPELQEMINDSRKRVMEQQQANVRGSYTVHRMAPDIALQKYIVSSARDAVMFADDPFANPGVVAALKDYKIGPTSARYAGPIQAPGKPEAGLRVGGRPYAAPEGTRPSGGYSMHDLVQGQLKALEEQTGADSYLPSVLRKHVMPSVFGYRSLEDGASHALGEYTRGVALKLSNSDFFKAVEGQGKTAERFVRGMRQYGKSPPKTSSEFGADIAKMFYGSTMGLNLGTAMTNLLQPLHNMHHLGFKNTVRAYAQSIEQMYEYGRARSRLGAGASPEQIEAAMDATMRRKLTGGVNVNLREISDIGSAWQMAEKPGYGAQLTQQTGGIFETIMKPFQLSEMVNRLVTSNAVLNAAEAGWALGGRKSALDPYRAIQEAQMSVEAMQFGSSALNKPLMFYNSYLKNPAIRQFLQFPVRSLTNLVTMPDMVGGSRNLFGMEINNTLGIRAMDTMRAVGVSAIAYEVLKDTVGADMSRGLVVGFVPDIDMDKDKTLPIPVPPFADAMYSGVRSVLSGADSEILADVMPLIVPGGVAISRALGGLPKSDALQALGLQKRFADWSAPDPEGNVPVFDSAGRMLGMYSGTDIILKSLGTDMGRFQNQGDVTQFLLKNRDQMRDQRRQWIASVLGNDMMKAGKVKANYERQFGMPLTVTQQQMQQAVKVREESIASRTVNSMDKDLQAQYKDFMAEAVPAAATTTKMPIEQNAQYVWSNLPKR